MSRSTSKKSDASDETNKSKQTRNSDETDKSNPNKGYQLAGFLREFATSEETPPTSVADEEELKTTHETVEGI